MKTTYLFAITTLLVALAGCDNHNQGGGDKGAAVTTDSTKAVPQSKPTQAKTTEMLPNEIKADDMSGNGVEQDNSGKKIIYWEDPMVSGRHFNKSGKSPFMDMQLTPKYAE